MTDKNRERLHKGRGLKGIFVNSISLGTRYFVVHFHYYHPIGTVLENISTINRKTAAGYNNNLFLQNTIDAYLCLVKWFLPGWDDYGSDSYYLASNSRNSHLQKKY